MQFKSLLDYYKFCKKTSIFIPIFAAVLFFIGIVKVYETWWLGLVYMCWGLFIVAIYIPALIWLNKKIKKMEAENVEQQNVVKQSVTQQSNQQEPVEQTADQTTDQK